MEEKILREMEIEELAAWKALAGYKLYMFGYHAAKWVSFNKLLENPLPNPFKELVVIAKRRAGKNG